MLPLKTTNLLAKTPNKKFPKERENSKRKIPLGKCYHAFLPRRLKQTELRLDNYLISRQISNLISDIIEWHLFKHDIYTLFNYQEDLSDFLVDSGFYEHLWSINFHLPFVQLSFTFWLTFIHLLVNFHSPLTFLFIYLSVAIHLPFGCLSFTFWLTFIYL